MQRQVRGVVAQRIHVPQAPLNPETGVRERPIILRLVLNHMYCNPSGAKTKGLLVSNLSSSSKYFPGAHFQFMQGQ